jgi:hypothetical protein
MVLGDIYLSIAVLRMGMQQHIPRLAIKGAHLQLSWVNTPYPKHYLVK